MEDKENKESKKALKKAQKAAEKAAKKAEHKAAAAQQNPETVMTITLTFKQILLTYFSYRLLQKMKKIMLRNFMEHYLL